MKILLDANVIFTFLSRREDKYLKETDVIIHDCINKRIDGFVAFHSLSIVWYLLRHNPLDLRLRWMKLICTSLKIANADNETVLRALDRNDFPDFEDNLQDCCARQAQVDYIVTANIKDYSGRSLIPAITPLELLRLLESENNNDESWIAENNQDEVRESNSSYQISKHIALAHNHVIRMSEQRCVVAFIA